MTGGKSSKSVRFIFVGSIVLLMFVLLFILIVTTPGERLIRRQMEIRLGRILGGMVRVGEMETNLLSRVQIRHVDVYHPDGAQFIRLKYGRVDYRIGDFLKRDISIRAIQIDSLLIAVRRDSAGQLIIPYSRQQDTDDSIRSAPRRIRLGHLNVRNAMVSYDDRQIPLQGAIYGIGIEYEQKETDVHHWSVMSDSMRLIFKGKTLPVTNLNAGGIIGPESWEIRSLEMRSQELILLGQASGGLAGQNPNLRGTFSLVGRIDHLMNFLDDALPQSLSPAYGEVELKLNLDGNRHHPELTGDVRLRKTQLGDFVIPDGRIQISSRDSVLNLEDLDIRTMGGRISGNGYIILDSLLNHRLSVHVQEVALPDLFKMVYHDSVHTDGIISGQLNSSGPITSTQMLRIETHLNLTQARYRDRPIPDLNMRLSTVAGKADIYLTQGENRLEANMTMNARRGEGVFLLDIHRIGPLAALMHIDQVSGSLQGHGRIIGDIGNPEISVEMRGEALRYQNFPMDSLLLNAAYRDGALFIQSATFSGQYTSDASLHPVFNSDLFQGDFSYRGMISGPVEAPRGEIQVKLLKPEFGDIYFDDGVLRINALQDQIHLDGLTLRKDTLLVVGNGQYSITQAAGRIDISIHEVSNDKYHTFTDREVGLEPDLISRRFGVIEAYFNHEINNEWRLEAKGTDLHLNKILTLYREKIGWRGTFGFDLALSGNEQNPQGLFRFGGDSVGTGRAFLDSVRATIELREHRITVAPLECYFWGRKSWVEADIELKRTASGGYTLTDESEVQGRAAGSGIDLRFLSPLLGLDAELSGISEYALEWRGFLGRPHVLGHFNVKNGQVRLRSGVDPIRSIEATLVLTDSLLQISSISGQVRDIPFQMEGRVTSQDWRNFRMNGRLAVSNAETMTLEGSKTPDSLAFHVDVHDLDLSLFRDFMSDVRRFEGRLSSRMDISGAVGSPHFFGFLEARKVLLHPQSMDIPFSGGIVKATFENEKIVLDTLFFKMNGGTVLAGGNTTLSGGEMTNLEAWISVDRVNIDRPGSFSLAVQSVRADMKKDRNDYSIGGDIILGESRIVQDVQASALLPFFQKVERPMAAPPTFFRKTRIDLRVRESDQLWIDNNIARLRLHSELGLIGTLAQPNLSGRLSVEEGYVLYMDRKFQVQQGVLDFVDPHRINPVVDFQARADMKAYQTWSGQPYTVSLSIQGSLDQVVLDLNASPPLDRSDIITLLTVGATREQLTGRNEAGKSSLGNVLEDRLGYLSSRHVSGFASRRIGNLLNLEDMTIDGNLFRFGKSWGPQLLASKRITDRMEISYTTRVGHANEQSIRLDYRLSKILSIEGQTDQQGRSGIDLKFRWKFK